MLTLFALLFVTRLLHSDYTYWRYGDGNFTNSLPQNHTFFPNGLFSESPVYEYKSAINQTYFYPLITETNEIFALTNNYTNVSNKLAPSYRCMAPLSLIKLNEYLDETIAILPLLTDSLYNSACYEGPLYAYPIYNRQEDQNEYIIINIGVPLNAVTLEYQSYLWLINATSMSIIANISRNFFFYADPIDYAPYMNVIMHNQYIINSITKWPDYGNDGRRPIVSYIAYNLQGEQTWIMNISYPVGDPLPPIAINNKIIIPQITWYEDTPETMRYRLIAINISNGNIIFNASVPVLYNGWAHIIQPIVCPKYNLIIMGWWAYYDSFETIYAIDADDGATIGYQVVDGYGFPKPIFFLGLSDNDTLIISNFVLNILDCYDVYFSTLDIVVNNGTRNVSFQFIKDEKNQCHESGLADKHDGPEYYFMDRNGVSLIGHCNWDYNVSDPYIPIHTSVYSMVSDELQWMDNGTGFTPPNQKGKKDWSDRYPAVGSNGLIYFAGVESIYAYNMFVPPSPSDHGRKNDDIWIYFVAGGSALILVVAIGLVIICRKYCGDNSEENEKLIQ